MKKLPERLKAAASFIEKNAVIADVGCDHGFLPFYLLQNEIISYAYLIEKNRGPLSKASENAEKYGFSDMCSLVLSDGLKALPDYLKKKDVPSGLPDTVIMTGMGGPLILRIIDDAPDEIRRNVRTWILSPQSLISDCKEGLSERGFLIREEITVNDRSKSYLIMKVEERKV